MKKILSLLGLVFSLLPAGVLAVASDSPQYYYGMPGYNMMTGAGWGTMSVVGWFIFIIVGLILVSLFVLLVALIQRVI